MRRHALLTLVSAAALLAACDDPGFAPDHGSIGFTPDRPSLGGPISVAPYTGNDAIVLDAQARYATGLDLHRKFVMRTCGPNNGVCHNQKEYPNMHTAGAFAATIGAPCNVQPGSWDGVFDRCERSGDRFRIGDREGANVQIGWIEHIVGAPPEGDGRAPDGPGLHVHLQAPLPGDFKTHWGPGLFVRNFINDASEVQELTFANFNGRWTVLGDRTHLVADVNDWQVDALQSLLTTGIVQGDHNRNGVFGATLGNTISMLTPGKPEESYLIARMRGHMQGAEVPGSRMPLANQPPNVTDLLALFCFVEQQPAGTVAPDISGPIDYANCSYISDPRALDILGDGATWTSRIKPLMSGYCGGCHVGEAPAGGGLDLVGDGAYARLLGASDQRPELKLIEPGQPEQSYLWRKLSGDGTITGERMPIDALGGGSNTLPADALSEIENWILAGALQ